MRLPLRFFRDNDGHALVEPRTGAIVDLVFSEEAITATVDLVALSELRAVLSRAAGSSEAAALADALDALDRAAPAPVYSLDYEQTEASVAQAARHASNDLRQLDLVERYIPGGLAAVSVVLLVLAGVARWRGRATPPPVEGEPRTRARRERAAATQSMPSRP